MELLLGCGHSRVKRLSFEGHSKWTKLVTLDSNPHCKPDVIHDLNHLPYPFNSDQFHEIHAYETLEHCGKQGDWEFFFAQFDEFHRILKPKGLIFITSPASQSPWVWGDPSHTRYMGPEVYTFLSKAEYAKQLGRTPMSDFSHCFQSDWEIIQAFANQDHVGIIILRKI